MKGHSLLRKDTQGKREGVSKTQTCSKREKLQADRPFKNLCAKRKPKETKECGSAHLFCLARPGGKGGWGLFSLKTSRVVQSTGLDASVEVASFN